MTFLLVNFAVKNAMFNLNENNRFVMAQHPSDVTIRNKPADFGWLQFGQAFSSAGCVNVSKVREEVIKGHPVNG